MAANEVILARTHPFIVDHMKAMLTRNDLIPKPLTNLNDLKSAAASAAGIVISTSVVAGNTEDSPVEVLQRVRAAMPDMPVMLATLLPFEMVARNFQRSLAEFAPQARLIPLAEAGFGLGTADTLLVVHKDDLADTTKQPEVDAAVRKHFR